MNENDWVKMGAHHTLDLEANRDFRLWKQDGWDSVSLERVEEATKEGRGADIGAVVLGEGEQLVRLRRRIKTTSEKLATEMSFLVLSRFYHSPGNATICLLSEHMTVIRQRIDASIPRKRAGAASTHEKAMEKFFAQVYAGILKHLPYQSLRAIVLASPGFTKDNVSG